MIRKLLRIGSVCTLLLAGSALAQTDPYGASAGDTPSPPPISPPDTPTPDSQQHRMSPQASDGSQAGSNEPARKDKRNTRKRKQSKTPPSNGDDSQRPDSGGSTMP